MPTLKKAPKPVNKSNNRKERQDIYNTIHLSETRIRSSQSVYGYRPIVKDQTQAFP